MARIVNRSRIATVEVYGTTAAGVAEVFELAPGQQTADDFTALEVRSPCEAATEIFETDAWWQIHTPYAFVYTFDDGLFWDDLTLHCVPFRSASGAAPWAAGYTLAGTNATRDSLALTSPRLRGSLEHLPGPFDSELADIPNADFDFGIQVRTTIGNVTYVSVRLGIDPRKGLTSDELRSIWQGTPSRVDLWKDLIERTWAQAQPAADGRQIACEVDWLGLCQHYIIRIHAERDMSMPTTYCDWPIELDTGATGPGSRPVCAHEFGHHLGLNDGYVIEPEIPYLIDDPRITAILGAKTLKATKYWTYLDRLFPDFWLFGLGKSRAQLRLAGGACSPPGDIMDDQYAIDNNRVAQIIDPELAAAILERRPQGLCYALRQFDPKYVN